MILNKNIVLIGMMGSGKSTIGYLLSKKIGVKFEDIDKIIEIETGYKINDIFTKKGELYFRNLEEKITLKLLKSKKKIISLGGGAFLNKNIRKEILNNSLSFWLNWKNSTIIKRIYNNKKRPLVLNLSQNDLKELAPVAEEVNTELLEIEKLTDDELRHQTSVFKKQIKEATVSIHEEIEQLNTDLKSSELSISEKEAIFIKIEELEKSEDKLIEDVLK